jgi:hypothetical protein
MTSGMAATSAAGGGNSTILFVKASNRGERKHQGGRNCTYHNAFSVAICQGSDAFDAHNCRRDIVRWRSIGQDNGDSERKLWRTWKLRLHVQKLLRIRCQLPISDLCLWRLQSGQLCKCAVWTWKLMLIIRIGTGHHLPATTTFQAHCSRDCQHCQHSLYLPKSLLCE